MNFPAACVAARCGGLKNHCARSGNHYSLAKRRLRLRKAIKEFYGTQFGKELDHETERVVTSGANDGTFCVLIVRAVSPSHTHLLLHPHFVLPKHVSNRASLCMLKASWCTAIGCLHDVHRAGRRSDHLPALVLPIPTVHRVPRREVRLRPSPSKLSARPEHQDREAVMDDRF